MKTTIRGERRGDEEAIESVVCQAFASIDEANIVNLMRAGYPAFDRRYSIVARKGDEIVGHALFTPCTIRLHGHAVRALALGPIAVLPELQGNGIGGDMLRHGHELGRREGFALSLLQGHPSYYPRHGYKACSGFAKVAVDVEKLPQPAREFRVLPVRPADLSWLVERWEIEWADVDFAWLWGPTLSEWRLTGLRTNMLWTHDGRRAAYVAWMPRQPGSAMILSDERELARDVIATLKPKTLLHHADGWLNRAVLGDDWTQPEVKRHDAAMAYELTPGVLTRCLEALESGQRSCGTTMFPLTFWLC